MIEGAAKAVAHALARHEWLKNLDKHDPVPPTKEMIDHYAAAERRLNALLLKYRGSLSDATDEAATAALAAAMGQIKSIGRT